jgi:hypothetical protein
MDAVVAAIGAAMDEVSAELAGRVVPRLRAPARPAPTEPAPTEPAPVGAPAAAR